MGQWPALRVGRQLATLRQVDTGVADAQREYGRGALGFHAEQVQLGAETALTDQPAPGIEGVGFPGQAYPTLAGDAGKISQRIDTEGQCGNHTAPVIPYRGEKKGNRVAPDKQRRYKERLPLQHPGQQIGIVLRYRREFPEIVIEVGCDDSGITIDEIEARAAQSFPVLGKQTLQRFLDRADFQGLFIQRLLELIPGQQLQRRIFGSPVRSPQVLLNPDLQGLAGGVQHGIQRLADLLAVALIDVPQRKGYANRGCQQERGDHGEADVARPPHPETAGGPPFLGMGM